jgi:hypothetical protein
MKSNNTKNKNKKKNASKRRNDSFSQSSKLKTITLPSGNNHDCNNEKNTHHGANDWVSDLARKVCQSQSPTLITSSRRLLSKQERIEKRLEKQRRREERKQGRLVTIPLDAPPRNRTRFDSMDQTQRTKHTTTADASSAVTTNNKASNQLALDFTESSEDKYSKRRAEISLNKLSLQLQSSINKLYRDKTLEEQKYSKPFTGSNLRGKAASGQQLSNAIIQPRKKDYGGLGLARPSLLLDLRDISFIPKLEEEFAEHVPGFFGKQRTKGMKKQLDGNMLWRRLASSKTVAEYDELVKSAKELNGKKLSEMTPDERVEAMIKLNIL